MQSNSVHSVDFIPHFIGATLVFKVSTQHSGHSSVTNHFPVFKQFFWSKDKAQNAFDFAAAHNPYNN